MYETGCQSALINWALHYLVPTFLETTIYTNGTDHLKYATILVKSKWQTNQHDPPNKCLTEMTNMKSCKKNFPSQLSGSSHCHIIKTSTFKFPNLKPYYQNKLEWALQNMGQVHSSWNNIVERGPTFSLHARKFHLWVHVFYHHNYV